MTRAVAKRPGVRRPSAALRDLLRDERVARRTHCTSHAQRNGEKLDAGADLPHTIRLLDMKAQNSNPQEKIGIFQIIVLVLSIVVLGALFVDTAFKLPPEVSRVLNAIDTSVCLLLLADFGWRFYRAPAKWEFLKWGWIDLLASIPSVPALRVGRLIRIVRIVRLIRALRATHRLSGILFRDKIRGGFASVVLSFVLLAMFSSVGILVCEEPDPSANIHTAEDSLWWSISTLTTVGGSDLHPVTTEGRVLAMALTICGMGMFGAISGMVASLLLGEQKKQSDNITEISEHLKRLETKIDALQSPPK